MASASFNVFRWLENSGEEIFFSKILISVRFWLYVFAASGFRVATNAFFFSFKKSDALLMFKDIFPVVFIFAM